MVPDILAGFTIGSKDNSLQNLYIRLMRFLYLPAIFCLLVASCREAPPPRDVAEEAADSTAVAIPERIALNAGAQAMVESWAEYRDWEERMEVLLATEAPEEVRLLTEELLELTEVLEASEFPEKADRPAVRSRIKVVRTFLLQLQADFHYRLPYRFSQKRTAEAYNALKEQLNRVPGMDLDPQLFER